MPFKYQRVCNMARRESHTPHSAVRCGREMVHCKLRQRWREENALSMSVVCNVIRLKSFIWYFAVVMAGETDHDERGWKRGIFSVPVILYDGGMPHWDVTVWMAGYGGASFIGYGESVLYKLQMGVTFFENGNF